MKLISMLLTFCISLNVFAATGTVQELEKQLDEYQYAMSVEWDQKDMKFYEAQTNAFFAKLAVLVQEKGLKQEEMMSLLEKKVTNKASLEAMKMKLSILTNVKSSSELAQVLKENSKDFYAQGASWNGDILLPVGLGLLVAAVVGYAIWFAATHERVAWEQRWECNSYSNYDYDYGYGTGYSSCGWEDYCTRYVKSN